MTTLSDALYTVLFVHVCAFCLSVCLSVCPSVCACVCLSSSAATGLRPRQISSISDNVRAPFCAASEPGKFPEEKKWGIEDGECKMGKV